MRPQPTITMVFHDVAFRAIISDDTVPLALNEESIPQTELARFLYQR